MKHPRHFPDEDNELITCIINEEVDDNQEYQEPVARQQ
jgi:hypothetical protein